MTLIEAKVEAALLSRLADKAFYIVEDKKGDFLLDPNPRKDAATWYSAGCEHGIGVHLKVTKWDEKQAAKNKRKKTADELIDAIGETKPKRIKQPKSTELTQLKFDSLEAASKSAETGLFTFKDKQWAVSVRGSWVLHKHIMDKIDGGLVLVVREQGWYNYPKAMWNEFDGIFKSASYDKGSYSQSILPAKFAKYFKKF